jgi:hypothetical protein
MAKKPVVDPYAGMDPATAQIMRASDQRRKKLGITPASTQAAMGKGTVKGNRLNQGVAAPARGGPGYIGIGGKKP